MHNAATETVLLLLLYWPWKNQCHNHGDKSYVMVAMVLLSPISVLHQHSYSIHVF